MVHKVNETARFFESHPREEALLAIADHIDKFWEKRFRRQLLEYAGAGGEGLSPLALAAVQTLRTER